VSIRRLVLLAAPLVVALAAVAPLARASPASGGAVSTLAGSRAGLRVSAPPECPGAPALERAVAAHVGRDVALDGVAVSIRREPSAWRARLQTADGERQLDAESCQAALEAVALVLALAVEPEPDAAMATAAPATTNPPSSPGLASATEEESRAAAIGPNRADAGPAASAPADRDERVTLGLSAGLLAEVGVLPAPSLGARLAIGAGWRAWRLELAGVALLPRRAELEGSGDLSARIGWWAAQLAACRRVVGPLEGCLGSELGELRGEGSGVDAPRTARGTWFAETLSALWSPRRPRPSGPWSWQLGTSVALAVVRPEFGFDGLGVLHRPSPISGRLWLAIDWR
jgi:hypothetical protein